MYRQINLAERNVKWGERGRLVAAAVARGGRSEDGGRRGWMADARRREGGREEGVREEIDVGGVIAKVDKSWQV